MIVEPLLMPNEAHILTKEEILIICGHCLGMCYEKDGFDKIKNEPDEKAIKRAMGCIKSGHHSGFEHVKFTFEITGISKIFATILNSQRTYTTSEKSGRYTVLNIEDSEDEALRVKWQEIFSNKIEENYYEMFKKYYTKPDISEEKIESNIKTAITKKAQENSRLITNPFAKAKMIYTINARQLSYLRYELKEFIKGNESNGFYDILKTEMQDFLDATSEFGLEEEGLNPGAKKQILPFFETAKEREEEFGENYSMNYEASLATFSQLVRHRTISYLISIPEEKGYFIPELIRDDEALVEEWLKDCQRITDKGTFPQATMLKINERGRYEDFILKCYERLCGDAQYEITMVTKTQLDKYIKNTTNKNAKEALEKISTGARCTFGYACTRPCVFGVKNALDRKF